ncbi:MAG: HTTM domain-containing protein [Cyclobacteriaceae bacterium]|nr:HTTM domain-containing protein [Cyclobacteriaceae bacterium]
MWLINQIDAGIKCILKEDSEKVIFFKAIYVFVLIKLWVSWSVLESILAFIPAREYSLLGWVLHLPLHLFNYGAAAFVIVFTVILLTSLATRLNYLSSFLVFWFSVCLSKFLYPVLNGTDLVLNLFLLIGLGVPTTPVLKWNSLKANQKLISAFGVLLIKVEIALIYFLSGYDKLITTSWRNGDAIFAINNLDFFSNPNFVLQPGEVSALVIAWFVILFEISFAFFVWFKKLKKYWLLAGVVFHLAIIIFMGLLDFGIIMILSYLIFIPVKHRTTPDKSIRSTLSQ